MTILGELVAAAMAAHDGCASDVGMGGGPPLYRVAMERRLEEHLEPIAARLQREHDELRSSIEGHAVLRVERERDQLRAELADADADAAMLRLALADSQAGLAARASRWDAERAQLLDLALAQSKAIEMLRHAPGRGERP